MLRLLARSHMNFLFALCLVAPSAILYQSYSSGVLAAKQASNLEIDQKHKVLGSVKIDVGKTFFRMQLKSTHLQIESFAPSWDVIILQEKRRVYRRMPLSKFQAPFITRMMETYYPFYGPSAVIDSKNDFQENSVKGIAYRVSATDGFAKLKEATCFDLPVAPGKIMTYVYNLPKRPGLPWEFFLTGHDDVKKETLFNTLSYKKTSAGIIPTDLSKYVPAKSEVDLMDNPARVGAFSELLH